MRVEIREEERKRIKAGADPKKWTEEDVETVVAPVEYHVPSALAEAHGIFFLCPKCFITNGGKIGTHGVLVGFDGRAPAGSLSKNSAGQDSRWTVEGACFEDLTLNPSILLNGPGCGWHGFVRKGRVTEA